MIRELRVYPAYKPSGVHWLGDVPAHWEIRRLGHIATKFGSGITPRGGATVYQEVGIPFLRSQNIHFDGLRLQNVARIASSLHQELSGSHVKPGDVLLNITGASIGRACSVPDSFTEGNVNQHVCIIRPDQSRLLSSLLAAYLSTPMMQREIHVEQKGASREGLTLQSIRGFRVIVPPLPEQRAIARYLDHVDRRIQRYIEAKEQLIVRLQEARQSIIQRAVTRGLDPDAPRKPSGVDWLGDVPAHWDVRRLKYLYHEVNERSRTGAEELMSVSHKTGVTPRKKNVTMFRAETNVGYKLCRPGDIVINTMWAYMAALGVARQVGLVSPSYNVYRPIDDRRMNPHYIDPLLRTETYRTEYLVRSTGITVSRLRLYPDSFLDIPLLYPPVEEQTAIATYLDKATAAIDTAIDNARRQSERMAEFRASLIAHVVTGKLDVRAAAERTGTEPSCDALASDERGAEII